MTFELQMLFASAVVLIVLLAVQGMLTPLTHGFAYGLGARDQVKDPSVLQGRLNRVVANTIEGMALFGTLIVTAHLAGVSSSLTQFGAGLFVAARIGYAVVYAAGIPVLRTAVWSVGTLGLFLIAWEIARIAF